MENLTGDYIILNYFLNNRYSPIRYQREYLSNKNMHESYVQRLQENDSKY